MQYVPSRPTLSVEQVPVPFDGLPREMAAEAQGAVFTRPEVVDFILDLAGYTTDRPLHTLRLLEPSVGEGAFLVPVIRRLLQAWRRDKKKKASVDKALSGAIRAVEVHDGTYRKVLATVVRVLVEEGLSLRQAQTLTRNWLIQGDFLLLDWTGSFDIVIGNPPYVRQELIPSPLVQAYRSRYVSFYDRADLYVPFIERSLSLLSPEGRVGFICANRWMKNKYGGPLRKLIAKKFHLEYYIDMVDTNAFDSEVSAYPAIIVLTPGKGRITRMAHRPAIDAPTLTALAVALKRKRLSKKEGRVTTFHAPKAGEPWLLEATAPLELARRLEAQFPLLEKAGCKVGIGVATGADSVFIAPYDSLPVEADRKLPLVRTKDILENRIQWQGLGVINPFTDSGQLVNLQAYPQLRDYLARHGDQIRARHVAAKNPDNWFRTIDRITPSLLSQKKLLIPDIKGDAQIVYDEGAFYPHHNLYYIVSSTWDLKALQTVLRSGIAQLFVSLYSTKMRGGYLRFQAQYLRRIRIPYWANVPKALQKKLIAAAESNDVAAGNRAVAQLYQLSPAERVLLEKNRENPRLLSGG